MKTIENGIIAALEPGDSVYTLVGGYSSSGLTRWVRVFVSPSAGEIAEITYPVARRISAGYSEKRAGIIVRGCGFSAGFDVVSALSLALFGPGNTYTLKQKSL